jgi:hypothetical protein
MDKRLFLVFILFAQQSEALYAQWTKEDSVWLKDVLSGKKELRLKPEVLKAIESGTFINSDYRPYVDQLMTAPRELPITKDFSEYVKPSKDAPYPPESKLPKIDYEHMPPALFLLYIPDMRQKEDTIRFNMEGLENIPVAPRFNLTTDPLNKGLTIPPPSRSFNAAGSLEYLFSPTERAKARNRKNANAWKKYNN